jgi:alpha-D-xyloside xylohydrolase
VRDIADEYMFGPAFLVSPVYEYGARQRKVYLPAGAAWYELYTNRKFAGGKAVVVQAPLSRMPLFIREGSIVPVGPEIQYTGQQPAAPISVLVYTGRDGTFSLYEDEATNYNYEKGAFSTIAFSYNDAKGELTIGRRTGEFAGMPTSRTFNIRWITPGAASGTDFNAKPDQVVEYSGENVVIRRKR